MLPQNARSFLAVRSGTRDTVTVKLQAAVCVRASRAEHEIVVAPSPNRPPLAGVQLVVTGAVPPVVSGALKDTVTGLPSVVSTCWAIGHEIASAIGVGPAGVLQAPRPNAPAAAATRAAAGQRESCGGIKRDGTPALERRRARSRGSRE